MDKVRVFWNSVKQLVTPNGGWAAYTQGAKEAGSALAIGIGLLSTTVGASAAMDPHRPPLEAAAIALATPTAGAAVGFALGAGGRFAVNMIARHPVLAACGAAPAFAMGALHYAHLKAKQAQKSPEAER